MRIQWLLAQIISVLLSTALNADPIISLYLRPYPLLEDVPSATTFVNELGKPTKIAKHTVRFVSEKVMPSGIFALYAGNVALSDSTGQIVFPYKHNRPFVYLLITDHITPTVMFYNTLKNWEIERGTPARMFSLERKQDPQTNLYYWDVQEVDLPANNVIPLEAIVLLTNPKHIYVPTGITVTQDSPNLLLPDVFVRKGINTVEHALYILNLLQFFGSIETRYKLDTKRYLRIKSR
jgi:hypothetical protein